MDADAWFVALVVTSGLVVIYQIATAEEDE
jgi:hypothetical protein